MWSTTSKVWLRTVRSHAPNVGICMDEDPQATSSTVGSTSFMALPAWAASRPYSSAVFWPICHGPSISLPSDQSRTPYGSVRPLAIRRSAQREPATPLQYSTRAAAAATPRVPRLTAIIGSTPLRSAHCRNSSVPTSFGSTVRQARSMNGLRSSRGPTPSSQT